MLVTEFCNLTNLPDIGTTCDRCQKPATIKMMGYGDSENGECNWCTDCTLQLVRLLAEDICELLTRGGRHG
jgi:hypothetical protein